MTFKLIVAVVSLLFIFKSKNYSINDVRINVNQNSITWIFVFSLILVIQTALRWKYNNTLNLTDLNLIDFFGGNLISPLLISPITEEIFFRGLIFRFLTTKFGVKSSAIMTSLTFLVGHTDSSSPLVVLYVAFLFSMLLCSVCVKYGLLNCIIIHSFVNLFSSLIGALVYNERLLSTIDLSTLMLCYVTFYAVILLALSKVYSDGSLSQHVRTGAVSVGDNFISSRP